MKKIAILVALMLCVCSVAFAATNSKTTGDITTPTATTTNTTANTYAGTEDTADEQVAFILFADDAEEAIAKADAAIEELAASASPDEFFGVNLSETLGTENVAVYELSPVKAVNYDPAMGDVEVQIQTATPYTVGDQVVVLFGLTVVENNEEKTEWTALNGLVNEDGTISVTLPGELAQAIQDHGAMMAIASKTAE